MQNLESVLKKMHTALVALTGRKANDSVANSQKNIGGMVEAAEAMQSDNWKKETKLFAHDHFSGTVLSAGTPSRD